MKLLFALFILIPVAAAGASERTAQVDSLAADCAELLEVSARDLFIKQWANRIFAGEKQNQAWIDDALAQLKSNDLHVLIENAWLKRLNDKVFKNLDFVTALTNFHKSLLLEEIAKLGQRLKLKPYQDFKSTRLTFRGPPTPDFLAALEEAFINTNRRFYESDQIKAVVRPHDLKHAWFRMGVGQSEGQAALAARDARENGGDKNISYFWDKSVRTRLERKLIRTRHLHQMLLEKLKGSDLLVQEQGGTFVRTEALTIIRKSAADMLLPSLRENFPDSPLDEATADLLFEYAAVADEFSPSILVPKRELLTIQGAPNGVIALDFIGLGAENLDGTLRALILSRDLNEAVRLCRANERLVTQKFEALKKKVHAAVNIHFAGRVSMRFSGDDGIIVPETPITLRDQILLGKLLSLLMPKPYFRMSVINGDGATADNSMELISHGQIIEKKLRALLLTTVGPKRLKEFTLQTFIPDPDRVRTVYLVLNGVRDITGEEIKLVRRSFFVAVKLLEAELHTQGHKIEYVPTEIYALFGDKLPALD